MQSESVCVSLENGRATATMAIRMPRLSLSQARPFCRNGLSLKLSKIARFGKKELLQVQELDGWRRCPELNTGIRALRGPRLSAWLHRHKKLF